MNPIVYQIHYQLFTKFITNNYCYQIHYYGSTIIIHINQKGCLKNTIMFILRWVDWDYQSWLESAVCRG